MKMNVLYTEQEMKDMGALITDIQTIRNELIGKGFNPPWSVTRPWEYSKVIQGMPAKPGDKILDIGSNTSIIPFWFKRNGCDVYACDIVKPTFSELKYYKDKGINYKKAGMADMPYADNFFDGVCSVCTLEHIYPWKDDNEILKETVKGFKEIARVLKPGGITVHSCDFYVPNFNTFRTYHEDLLLKLIKALEPIFEPLDVPDYHIADPFAYYISNNTQYANPAEREEKHLKSLKEGVPPPNLFTCACIALRKK